MPLQYLENYRPFVNLDALRDIHKEKESWKTGKLTSKYIDILNEVKEISHIEGETLIDDYVEFKADISCDDASKIEKIAKDLIPWRKGPFKINDLDIDTEWRSNLKWQRIQDKIGSLEGKTVLDVGCNNGYYMWQMLKDDPKLVLGIDPVPHNMAQFEFINSLTKKDNLKFELFGIEDITNFRCLFDVIFSMGIIYHHRHPLEQLIDMRNALTSEGTLILETIGIPGEGSHCLFPEGRYAKMRNVWFLPTLECLKNWMSRTGFTDIEVLSVAETTNEEQRLSPWCPPPFQSLEEFLDPNDKTKTVEGHPAPVRFCIKAKKKVSPQVGF